MHTSAEDPETPPLQELTRRLRAAAYARATNSLETAHLAVTDMARKMIQASDDADAAGDLHTAGMCLVFFARLRAVLPEITPGEPPKIRALAACDHLNRTATELRATALELTPAGSLPHPLLETVAGHLNRIAEQLDAACQPACAPCSPGPHTYPA